MNDGTRFCLAFSFAVSLSLSLSLALLHTHTYSHAQQAQEAAILRTLARERPYLVRTGVGALVLLAVPVHLDVEGWFIWNTYLLYPLPSIHMDDPVYHTLALSSSSRYLYIYIHTYIHVHMCTYRYTHIYRYTSI